MTKQDCDMLMKVLNDAFGGFPPSVYDTWYAALNKFNAVQCKQAVWKVIETMKTKPRVADVLEAMGRGGTTGGGSKQQESNGCTFCGGSGWASVEKALGDFGMYRCICERGEPLSKNFYRLTDEMIRNRRPDVRGILRMRNKEEEDRQAKLLGMTPEEKIRWCRKGLRALEAHWK